MTRPQNEMDVDEFREKYLGEVRPHKYGAKPTTVGGVRYDSKYEAEMGCIFEREVTSGALRWVLRQVPIPLGPDFTYRLDFLVQLNDRRVIGHEVKGVDTPRSKQIAKLWRKYGPFELWVHRRAAPVEIIPGGNTHD